MKARDDEEELADDEDKKKSANSVVHEVVNKRWEVCVTTSTRGFQQASFVNSIATTKVQQHLKHFMIMIIIMLMLCLHVFCSKKQTNEVNVIREVYDKDGLSLHVTGFDRSVSSIANESVKAYQ